MKDVRLAPRAGRDLGIILDHLEHESASPTMRRRFLMALEETSLLLAAYPGMGRKEDFRLPSLHSREIRRFPVCRFPKYLIFYAITDVALIILRILHGARDLKARATERT